MAKKQSNSHGISMAATLAEFKELKNINKETLVEVLHDSFMSVLAKMYGTSENCTVIVNVQTGDLEIWRELRVVEDGSVQNPNFEIELSEAKKKSEEIAAKAGVEVTEWPEVGEQFDEPIDFYKFGRRAILNLGQIVSTKLQELEKIALFTKFQEKKGSLISADVYQVWKREVLLIDDEGNELLLPKSEQIPGDFFVKGSTVRAVVHNVEMHNNQVRIYVSRTSKEFLMRLFELNVPEIAEGLITIKRVARIPGERAKIAVESYDDRIDPVGACVGMNGSRIRGIVRELRGENIDVTTYTPNTTLFIQRALSPAKVTSIDLFPDTFKAEVYLRPEEVPMAIGKNAFNITLASSLTGYTIEVFRDIEEVGEEDIYLDEFSDEIDDWVIETLKNLNFLTAKSVLSTSREELIKKTDLEESTIDQVLSILASEFEPVELLEIGYKGITSSAEQEETEDEETTEEL